VTALTVDASVVLKRVFLDVEAHWDRRQQFS
jgi:hypothetical protein